MGKKNLANMVLPRSELKDILEASPTLETFRFCQYLANNIPTGDFSRPNHSSFPNRVRSCYGSTYQPPILQKNGRYNTPREKRITPIDIQ